jgi:arylsulfatase A-like enzyme
MEAQQMEASRGSAARARWLLRGSSGLIAPAGRLAVALAVFLAAGQPEARAADARPNLLWISAEDISAATVGCYGGAAHTPRIDALASEGIRYDKAYSAAPVCAPSRSAIITGIMPTTLGSLPMRCRATPPPFLVGFPRLLREAGYFCTNNVKTDYNLAAGFDAGWNESSRKAHWRNRPDPSQPFFAVFNFTVSHESGLFAGAEERAKRRASLPAAARRQAKGVRVPPWYPDTPVVREDLAHRLELATLLDREVGRVLDELEKAGLADDTIVVFWGDHGEGIPRGKRSLTEFGLRVPLIVRVPERFRGAAALATDAAASPGGRSDALVGLVDLGPTMLDLAGVAIPTWMEGRSFLGPHAPPSSQRRIVVGVRDRMDEHEGFGRSLTDGRHRYVRNVFPWVAGDDLPGYADGVAITLELRRALADGTLPPGAEWFARRFRPPEELYDLERDPDELHNLAGSPEHAGTLARLRGELVNWMRATRDTGVLPEGILRREAAAAGSEYAVFHPEPASGDTAAAERHARLVEAMLQAGEAGLTAGEGPRERFAGPLAAADPALRYWAALGVGFCGLAAGESGETAIAREATELLLPVCADADGIVAVAAARWIVEIAHAPEAVATARRTLLERIGSGDPDIRQAALVAVDRLLTLDRFGEDAGEVIEAVAAIEPAKGEEYAERLKKRIGGRKRPARIRKSAGGADGF